MKKKTATIMLSIKAAILGMAAVTAIAQTQGQSQDHAQGKMQMMAQAQPSSAKSGRTGPAQGAAALPNGANALNETFSDWQVVCRTEEKGKACAMVQQQRKQDTNQLVLAMELTGFADAGVAGTFVLPFGFRLADGVTLGVDEDNKLAPLAFSTCLPVGCIVPFRFGAVEVAALKKGKAINLSANANDSGNAVALSVSLNGFSSAVERVAALAGR